MCVMGISGKSEALYIEWLQRIEGLVWSSGVISWFGVVWNCMI